MSPHPRLFLIRACAVYWPPAHACMRNAPSMLTDHCMRRASGRNPLAFAPLPHALRNDHRPTPRAITTTATGPALAPTVSVSARLDLAPIARPAAPTRGHRGGPTRRRTPARTRSSG